MTGRQHNKSIEPLSVRTLQDMPDDDLVCHVESILVSKGAEPLTDLEVDTRRVARARKAGRRIMHDATMGRDAPSRRLI